MFEADEKKRRILSVIEIIGGSVLYSLVVQLFVLPVDLLSGGATGIAIALHGLYDWDVSVVLLVVNVFLLILGWVFLGRRFAMTTILSTFIIPVSLAFFEKVLADVVLTHDIMLNVMFASLGVGVSVGIVLRAGGSTGGSDIPPMIFQKYFNFPAAIGVWILDSLILLAQGIVYDAERILYGLLIVVISSIVMDKTMVLGSNRTELKIISEKSDEIRSAIISELDRSVTMLQGKTGYLKNDTELVLSVISNRELPRIERLIHRIDPDSFMIITRVSEVKGNGFSYRKPGE